MSHIKKSENRTWTYKIICIKNDQSFVLWSMFILYPNTSTTKSQYGDELNSTVSQTQRWLIHMGLCLLLYPLKIQRCNSHRLKHLSGGKLQHPNTDSLYKHKSCVSYLKQSCSNPSEFSPVCQKLEETYLQL